MTPSSARLTQRLRPWIASPDGGEVNRSEGDEPAAALEPERLASAAAANAAIPATRRMCTL